MSDSLLLYREIRLWNCDFGRDCECRRIETRKNDLSLVVREPVLFGRRLWMHYMSSLGHDRIPIVRREECQLPSMASRRGVVLTGLSCKLRRPSIYYIPHQQQTKIDAEEDIRLRRIQAFEMEHQRKTVPFSASVLSSEGYPGVSELPRTQVERQNLPRLGSSSRARHTQRRPSF